MGHLDEPHSRSRYSRVPREVAEDRRLKHRDVRVYSVLASRCWQGNVATIGKRQIAMLTPCAERLVIDSLKRLEETGHIRKLDRRRGQRGVYQLLSDVFGQKQRNDYQDITLTPNGQRRLATVRKDRGLTWTNTSVLESSLRRERERKPDATDQQPDIS
jgi:hypothetical protein